MKRYRFFCRPINMPVIELVGIEARHLSTVLRLNIGDEVEVFDGAGALVCAMITGLHRDRVTLTVDSVQQTPQPERGQIVIAASIAKGERFDWLIGKCTELGVDRIMPVLYERTVKQSRNPKTIGRWENLIIAAAKQCRRLFLPRIDPPQPLSEVLQTTKNDYPQGRILLGSLNAQAPSLTIQKFDLSDVIAFVGPEGGLTEKEQDLLKSGNAQPVCLTDTTLRIETAAIAFAAILTAQRHG
ncbi:MAG: 16S rRNA (uracil(1498)-N(3))-methyltransferase [Sedimentisphaerales bacterium]|nr:16S rRNA (uracil(1498)-N(3))-methyltransferase [Sedimentisphaerales bacterium]